MLSTSESRLSSGSKLLQTRLTPALTLLFLFFALVVFIISPILFFQTSDLALKDQLGHYVIQYLSGLVYLACGLYIFWVRRFDPAGRAFAVFSSSAGIALAFSLRPYPNDLWNILWTIALALAGGALINLALLFPESVRQVARFPWLGWIGYGLGALLTLVVWIAPLDASSWRLFVIFLAVSAAFFAGMAIYRRLRSVSPVVREQARLTLWGAFIAIIPIGLWLALSAAISSLQFIPLLLLPLAVFPLLTAYAIIRYRFLSADYFLSQVMLYSLLGGLAMAGYALLVGGASLLVGQALQPTNPLLVGLMVLVVAIGLNPLRSYLQGAIDRFFFKGQLAFRELLQSFGRELTSALELGEIVTVLRKYVADALAPESVHVFVYNQLSGHYTAMPEADGRPTSDVRFPVSSALVQTLSRRRQSLFLSDISDLPEVLQAEQARLRLVNGTVFIPMPGRDQLTGWLALGDRKSGEPYTSRDLRLLETLSDQTALAVERAQVVADLERRVRELNVLARIAQGVSFTVTFDDILELISAQTSQVLPARELKIALLDKDTGILSYAFYLEDDERLNERENQFIPLGQGLENEVVSSQRWLVTDDYERECRQRGILPAAQDIYSWMGIPLNAGADTIGVLSIASRDPAVIYTEEQRNLLQAIADQASGAIVKARSLEESERRALQLATLNEVALSLTSTLEIKPLLRQILDSATDILNCEAGSLFLVDPQTDELIFEVVIGPVAADLTGKRLPPGTGLVGECAQTGQAIIANDAKRRMDWFNQTDQQTGFDTQDLLGVPMRLHDRVIGVIEVINKTNGAPFTSADQELLTAYASQATIAMENARLYTMTDQALAARVEELSVMQRIDRELNASLEIERAMRITLDWAMRQSQMDAGLVGMVNEGALRVMAAQGYLDELQPFQPSNDGEEPGLPIDLPAIKSVLETGMPRFLVSPPDEANRLTLLQDGLAQIAVPIRRETETIGVLLLESRRAETALDEKTSFMMRLSDHAAIAIANAQLYEEVKLANLAKSQFVSFVAHELKNPMASIKGYTELVAAGMAGPVNEMQTSFLTTVRSNVDRMNTIVSDLNDLTKIQVGNMRLDYQALPVEEVLEEVIRSLTRQIEEKNQQLIQQIPEDLPRVWADPARLAQIITNLVSNAQKYTPESGRILIGAERVEASESDPPGLEMIHLWVEDSGIGIAEEDQRRIFQQYFRTDDAKDMASGTGLGLAITRSLVEMQGGRIWFESRSGTGTTFHLTIPVAETQ
ncbi:MAG: hypothetical protein B6D39_04265 [Anaerolineae bacterium UTCFX2]|jgi:signal transduction histidine kinase|nr:MAG: hypothetical protein B6D39_04265 [Anaerolineae bacterium UTCFX2]